MTWVGKGILVCIKLLLNNIMHKEIALMLSMPHRVKKGFPLMKLRLMSFMTNWSMKNMWHNVNEFGLTLRHLRRRYNLIYVRKLHPILVQIPH